MLQLVELATTGYNLRQHAPTCSTSHTLLHYAIQLAATRNLLLATRCDNLGQLTTTRDNDGIRRTT
eukprot:1751168-Lingulodinium_polyedra.AAC.1